MKLWLTLSLAWVITVGHASEELLTFDSVQQEQRYNQLISELRCPKCLNQSIADSNAGISEDLRNLVYEKIKAGKSDREIKVFLSERYSDFILYKPETSGANLLLWFGPAIVLLIILSIVIVQIKKRAKSGVEPQMTEQEREKVQQLLGAAKDKKGNS